MSQSSIVDLLGETRAEIVRALKRDGERSAPEFAQMLGISDVAVRRHLALLAEEGLVADRTVNQGRGRPVARYRLTDRGEDLFPHRYGQVLGELVEFITEEQGRTAIRSFLKWRQERETERYGERVQGDGLPQRLEELAEALSEAGFEARVTETEDGYELTQTHCAVYDMAKEHPEMCAHEAAMFRRVLGDVQVSRRETIAKGSQACVCTVTTREGA